MILYNVGTLISELRKASGMSQERLAEGICSRETLGKIERGERRPQKAVFDNILERLGVSPKLYHSDVADADDVFFDGLTIKWQTYVTSRDFEAMKSHFDELKDDPRCTGSPQGKRMLLNMEAALCSQGPYQNSERTLALLYELVRTNRPNFDTENIEEYFLSKDEITLVLRIATAQGYLQGPEAALKTNHAVLKSIERNIAGYNDIRNSHIICIINIANQLMLLHRWEECIKYSDKCMEMSLGMHDMRYYMSAIYKKARCLFHLGRRQESDELFKKYLLFGYAVDGYFVHSFEEDKKNYLQEFGDDAKFDLTLEW